MKGSRFAHYEITAKIGQGGMGAVYRALDSKLGREVAIKVLPKEVSAEAQSLARFEREAKALAALNHPNIASIHGFDADGNTHFIVLELVEGETLCERLRRGKLPLDESLRIARQIAEALEAAHAKGIVHRDLKPGNIKFTSDGRVKVLDFGLAKLAAGAGSEDVTLKSEQTTPGAILGTPAYMSPEQARGQEVDKRTDVWAFGCCLFECLSGSKPFRGDTVTDLMAEVLKSEPGWSALPADVPREVLTLLRRCLEKDPRRRLSSLGDIAILLEDSSNAPQGKVAIVQLPPSPEASPSAPKRPLTLPFALALVLVSVGIGLALASWRPWRPVEAKSRPSHIRTLAVLPFEFETKDPKLSELGKWIPAEINLKLGSLKELRVVYASAKSKPSVKESNSELDIAKELNVEGLVKGELRSEAESLSVNFAIIDASTGRSVGKQQKITVASSQLPGLPNRVALAIIDQLRLELSESQRSDLKRPDTQNSDAFFAVQRGRDLLYNRRWESATAEYRAALRLDLNYLAAWVGLAHTEWQPLIYGGGTNRAADVFKRLSLEAERFRSLRPADPSLASLRFWIAFVYERDWAKAYRIFWEFQRTGKPDPDLLHCIFFYYCFIEGHPDVAFMFNDEAVSLAPDDPIFRIDRAHMLNFFGQPQAAVKEIEEIAPEKVQFEDFSNIYLEAEDLKTAKENAQKVLSKRRTAWTQCNLAAICARSGETNEAQQVLHDLEQQAANGVHIPYGFIAGSYGVLGDFDASRRWLRKGLEEGSGDWSMVRLRSAFNLKLFGNFPWFWEIVDEMKFPPLQNDHPFFAMEQEMRYHRRKTQTTSAGVNETLRTVAVLPFVNMSSDKENDYLSDGITEEILNTLAGVPGLRVPARSSSFYFKEKKESIRQIAEQLKVATVLEGGVRKAGNQLRITARLISVADGLTLWAGTYDRSANDVLAIQSEVAQSVLEALRVKLLGAAGGNEFRRGTDNLEAYDLFLRGRQLWNTRTAENIQRAIAYFEQAIEKDGRFAQAYAGLGGCYVVLPVYTKLTNPEALPKARAAARRAMELNPALAEAHLVLGNSYYRDGDFERAEPLYRQALKLNTNSATAHMWLAELLVDSGRGEPALAEMQLAQLAEPLSPVIHAVAARVLVSATGRYDEALAQVEKSFQLAPDFTIAWLVRGLIRAMQKHYLEAISDLEKTYKAGAYYNGSTLGYLGHCYAKVNRTNDARRLLEELKAASDPDRSSIYIAQIYHGLGDQDQAFTWLDRAAARRLPAVQRLKFLINWKEITSDPRYEALINRHALGKPIQSPQELQ